MASNKSNVPVLEFENGRFSFYRQEEGWFKIGFILNGVKSSDLNFEVSKSKGMLVAETEEDGICQRLVFDLNKGKSSLTVRRFIRNSGKKVLNLNQIEDGMIDDESTVKLSKMNEYTIRYVHTENVRTEIFPDSRPSYPYVKPIPYEPAHFNLGEGNNFPAFILTDEAYKSSLVEGDLNQTVFKRSWMLGLNGEGAKAKLLRTCKGIQSATLCDGFKLEPGNEIEVSRVFYQLKDNTHPQDAYGDYIKELRKYHEFCGQNSPMLNGAVFCTWNYGTLHNINEKLLVKRVNALAEKVPECTHFLIDDGYQANRNDRNAGICSFYPVASEGYDKKLFPSGMTFMADKIRQAGKVPCIWLSPKVYLDSKLAKERPEWILKDKDGSPELIGQSSFLDLSVKEAREFYLSVLDALFIDWGFRGVKYDFMSHWFSMEKSRWAEGGTGLQWRDFAFSEIRKRIGEDGLFMTCIAMSMGNPFPGLNADCYRCGCDIHDGTWAEQLKACKATLPQVLLEGRKTFLLNMDSAGFGGSPDNEQIFRLTWIFITQGILEIGGPVEKMPDRQLKIFRKLLKNADRGHKVRCLDERAFTGDGFPEILEITYPKSSDTFRRGVKKHLAFFNWSENTRFIGGDNKFLGIGKNDVLKNVWTGKKLEKSKELFAKLKAHSAMLIEVR